MKCNKVYGNLLSFWGHFLYSYNAYPAVLVWKIHSYSLTKPDGIHYYQHRRNAVQISIPNLSLLPNFYIFIIIFKDAHTTFIEFRLKRLLKSAQRRRITYELRSKVGKIRVIKMLNLTKVLRQVFCVAFIIDGALENKGPANRSWAMLMEEWLSACTI